MAQDVRPIAWAGTGTKTKGAQAPMGDNAEFEKLSTLEARLAAALDRIAAGVGEAQTRPMAEDPGITSGAFEDAQIRPTAAEARVSELEAMIAAQPAPGENMTPRLTALEADLALASAALADRDATIAALQADLAAARQAAEQAAHRALPAVGADAEPDPALAQMSARIADLEGRVARLRAERAEAIAERDEARDIAEELQIAGGMDPDDRAMALRAELQELRSINERLTKNVNRLRSERATDPRVLNKALVVELDALKAARASEAAELDRILADLGQVGPVASTTGDEHA